MTLGEINTAIPDKTRAALRLCCGSKMWTERMMEHRPFASPENLFDEADRIWFSLSPTDWLEAFAAHPKIGESSSSAWSSEEQRGMSKADSDTVRAIHELNTKYADQFGFIFIVCATGKSALDLRALLEQRLGNSPEAEVRIAADEQAKITRLRLHKLLAE